MANTVFTRVKIDSSQAVAGLKGFGAEMTKNVAIGTAMGNAISGAFSLAASGVGKMASAFGEASELSLSNIGAAGDLGRALGIPFGEAQKDIASFTKEMSVLAKDLPGSASMFSDIGISLSDNLAVGLKDVNGELDMEAFREYRTEFAKFGAMRTQFSGVQLADTNMFISKLLDGQSIASLKTLKFAESNVGVMAEIERQLSESGRELADYSKRELIELGSAAIGIQDEVIAAASASAEGIMAGFKDGIFNPDVGLFGLMRDLDTEVEGNQSAFANFERVLGKIFGPDGVMTMGSKLFSNLGLSIDPMQLLADGIGKIGGWIDGISGKLSTLTDTSDDSRGFDTGTFLSDMGSKAMGWISGQFNKLFQGVANMDAAEMGQKIAVFLTGAIDGASKFIADLDFGAIAGGILKIGSTVAIALVATVRAIDWLQLGEAILSAGLVAGIAVAGVLTSSFLGMSAAVGAVIAGASVLAVATFQALKDKIKGWAEGVGNVIQRFFNSVQRWATAMVNKIPGVNIGTPDRLDLESGTSSLANKASGLDQGGLFAAIARERRAMPNGANIVVANDREAIFNGPQQSDLMRALSGGRGQGGSIASVNHTNTFNISIDGSSSSNPKSLAKQVLQEIDREFQKMGQSQLAPNY